MGEPTNPTKLIDLAEACLRRGISRRSYWRDPCLLPPPIPGHKLLFSEVEVEQQIQNLLRERDPFVRARRLSGRPDRKRDAVA